MEDLSEVKMWLEWAGATLLSMPISSPTPRGPRVAWPEFAQDARNAYGYTASTMRAPLPRSREIDLMDDILALISIVGDTKTRRILHLRALVTPVSNRYVYSWVKLAVMFNSDRRAVAYIHTKGLREIATVLGQEKASTFHKRFITVADRSCHCDHF